MKLTRVRRLSASASAATVAVAAGLALLAGGAGAHEADGHPARIQEGTCDRLGRVAFELTGVGAEVDRDGTPVAAPQTMGSTAALPVQESRTALDSLLSNIVKGDRAIAVYESDAAMERPIACGNLGGAVAPQMAGMVMPGDELAVGLAEANGSGYAGVALIRPEEGGKATVRIFLVEGLAGGAAATGANRGGGSPVATPSA